MALAPSHQTATCEALWRLAEADKREHRQLEKRQTHRMAEEAAADNAKRPTGVRGFFARLTGKAKRIDQEITQAKSRRALRDKAEWKALDERQAEQRSNEEKYRLAGFEEEKHHFRVEARRLHERVAVETNRPKVRNKDRDRDNEIERAQEEEEERQREGRGRHLRP